MLEQPRARDGEFAALVRFAELEPGLRVCDVPAGGGYLGEHVPAETELISVEDSSVFARLAANNGATRVVRSRIEDLSLASESVDRVVSLAALHHVEDKISFHREAARVLRPTGSLCVADVQARTGVADFLNIFVHEHSAMGHEGKFLDESYPSQLEAGGFRVADQRLIPLDWHFENARDMTSFCGLLFGVESVGHEDMLHGIEKHLCYEEADGAFRLRWELVFFRAVRS